MGSGSFLIETSSVNLCTTEDGTGVIKTYTIPSASFNISTASFLDAYYIYAHYNSGSPVYSLSTNKNNIDDIQSTLIYTVTLGVGGTLCYTNWDEGGVLLSNKLNRKDILINGIKRESGLNLGESGSRYITISSGSVWFGPKNIILSSLNSSINRTELIYHSQSLLTGSLISNYINDLYDNGINLLPLDNNKFVTNWIYRVVGNLNSIIVQLSNQYNHLSNALLDTAPPPPRELNDLAILVGRAIFKKGDSNSSIIQSSFTTIFGGGITNHNYLMGLQGGTTDQYYHLTFEEYSQFQFGTRPVNYRIITGSQQITNTDAILYISASNDNVIITMPAAPLVTGQLFRFKKIDSSGNQVIISSSVNIDFDKTLILNYRGSSVTLHSDGNQYWIH